MNRIDHLIVRLKVVLGIVLVLNLGVAQSAFADPPAPPEPCMSEECFWPTQQSIFLYLFGVELGETDSSVCHIFDASGTPTPIDDPGYYNGMIFNGQTFVFNCTWNRLVKYDCGSTPRGQEVDPCLDIPPESWLSPEQIERLQAEQIQVNAVAGVMQTGLAQLPVVALAIDGVSLETGQFTSLLLILNVVESDHPLVRGGGSPARSAAERTPAMFRTAADEAGQDVMDVGGGEPPRVPNFIVKEDYEPVRKPDPCEECENQYSGRIILAAAARDLAIAEALAEYETRAAYVEGEYTNAVNEANATYRAEYHDAEHAYEIAFGAAIVAFIGTVCYCGYFGILGTLGGALATLCVITAAGGLILTHAVASAVFYAADLAAQVKRDNAIASAAAQKDLDLANAERVCNDKMNAAWGQYNMEEAAAWRELLDCWKRNGCDDTWNPRATS